MPLLRVVPAQERLDPVVVTAVKADNRLVVHLELVQDRARAAVQHAARAARRPARASAARTGGSCLCCRASPCTSRRRRCEGTLPRTALSGRSSDMQMPTEARGVHLFPFDLSRRPRATASTRSAIVAASSELVTSSSRIANSSPPNRATVSVGRTAFCEPAGDLVEHEVARLMAKAVIDDFEVVQVDEHDADQRAVSAGASAANAPTRSANNARFARPVNGSWNA